MPTLVDITEKKIAKKEKIAKTITLARSLFGEGYVVKFICGDVDIEKGERRIASITLQDNYMLLKDRKYEGKALEFGRQYEQVFGVKDFKIETDYSEEQR